MKRLLFIAICFCMALSVSAGKKKDFVDYRYELTLAKENVAATSGFKVFKVWSYGKKKELLTKDICMRNAVHGLLFKGLATRVHRAMCVRSAQKVIRHTRSTSTASLSRASIVSLCSLQAVAHSLPAM